MFEYIIVGAGLAGSVMAERIANILDEKVLVIERRNHIGGNCYDEIDKTGIIIHKYGPHIFHTNYRDVFKYLSQFTEWREYQHYVLGFIDGKLAPLPFNLNTLHKLLPESLAKPLEKKLLKKYNYGERIPILKLLKEDDRDLKFLANYIYEKVFLNYTIKQWGLKPDEIDGKVTERVPILLSRDNRYFQDKYQGVPQDGYTKMIQNILDHENIKIMLNTSHEEILQIKKDKILFMDKKYNGKVIFTGKIDELFNYRYGRLPYRSLDLKFKKLDQEWYQEAATINYPNDYDFTRITEFKHIHPAETKKTIILKEHPQEHIEGKNEPYYPILTPENQETYKKYKKLAENHRNLVLLGRLAEYRYYNMDEIVKRAFKVFEKEVR
ncbi:UDP-galactopyranose mutase [Methanothermobacter tenebrarum]|uniref:UDP-galactopyranose mutase n=1 Tax=Methanothermobacter tenebrarum TaxID=680118 RepID=A0A328P9B9_9EURY|nr:UDP-galactopyranose mutase [Methanothermobacter tenebrarum]MBC7101554.1 UDP-galactopyranose mutase [Methanobacteriales archaeon]NPV64580.1 UDP-galactopyranose mutase [Methanobacteriaceae archaeon]RAO78689.1 UDP-galactopyranose mutase [Methanothermobacter tenebrarum]